MKNFKYLFILTLTALVSISCEVEDGKNLNGPTTESISGNLSRGELQETIAGALADMRVFIDQQTDGQAVAGREYWRFQSSDPRWTGDLLTGVLDNNTFYTTNPYASRYATVKDVNLLLEGLANTTADFSAQEIAAARGFANTIKAHELLMVSNQQYENGMRVDVSDPDNLGPFVPYQEALSFIFNLLQDASTDLSNGGDEFPFTIPEGFSIASTPSDFLEFNRGLAARVEIYRGNNASAVSLLQDLFMDFGGDLYNGVYLDFALGGSDIPNPLFFALNSTGANARIAHPTYITDAEAGDTRVDKAVLRDESVTQANLTGNYDVFIYESNVDPVPILRNEELILLYAEANITLNPGEAVTALNIIRTSAGLVPYAGSNDAASLTNELLMQRRYSLFAEGGHRWIDVRRYDRLGELPIDRAGDGTFQQFPIPLTENQ